MTSPAYVTNFGPTDGPILGRESPPALGGFLEGEAARIVSAYRGDTMTDMLSEILRPILAKTEGEEIVKRSKATKGKGGKT